MLNEQQEQVNRNLTVYLGCHGNVKSAGLAVGNLIPAYIVIRTPCHESSHTVAFTVLSMVALP